MTIFISYAHEDEPHLEGFFRQLRGLRAIEGSFQTVSDHDIPPGSPWENWLQERIENVEGGVLLISSAFFASRWCENEAMALYSRLQPERILPVLVRSCLWEEVGWLRRYQLVNKHPVLTTGQDPDQRWTEIVGRILEAQKKWPLVAAQGALAPDGRSDEVVGINTLEEALTNGGGIAFFLGPGIHEMQGDTPAADPLRARLDQLTDHLSQEGPIHYLRTIVEEKLPGVMNRQPAALLPNESWRQDLVAFQASLARLGSAASRLVAKTLYQRHMALANISSLVLSLEHQDETPEEIEERTHLRNLFFTACKQIAILDRSSSLDRISNDIGLGVQGIFEQMMALTYVAFGRDLESSQDEQCEEWHHLFRRQISGDKRPTIMQLRLGRGRRFLALTHLEWLGDLLWHTLRFDTPLYPRPNDLAFQLSVCSFPFTPPRRETVGTIASLALPALVDKVRAWLERSGTDQHEIYRAVARGLCDAWSRRQRLAEPVGNPVPLAVTTNFDNELELILRAARISHHVLFPVHLLRRTSPTQGASMPPDEREDWMLYTEVWGEDREIPRTRSWEVLGRNELKTQHFHGPLLVKLYGSPLTKIDEELVRVDGSPNPGKRFEFSHRLIVSDLDLLAVMVKEWWPDGLANLLFGQPNRLICFLGYSPADVDSRLRLFEHVRQYEKSQVRSGAASQRGSRDSRSGPIVVMSPPEDLVYRKYLISMRTQVLLEDLDKICAVIRKCCDCEALDNSRSAT